MSSSSSTTTRLTQILAIEGDAKRTTKNVIDAGYHAIQRQDPLKGQSRRWQKKDDDAPEFPDESTIVQNRVPEIISDVREAFRRLIDVTATRDEANTRAKADVVLNGTTILSGIPATTLLWLEKQLMDLRTFLTHLPVLDPAETWTWDEEQGIWITAESRAHRTAKVVKSLVLYPATDRHPAQVDKITEDVIIGYWVTRKFSGAIPRVRKEALIQRAGDLLAAVKKAREAANMVTVSDQAIGQVLMHHVFSV